MVRMMAFWRQIYETMDPQQKTSVDQLAREGLELEMAVQVFVASGRNLDSAREFWRRNI
jgi:hypothetical protein